MIECLAEAYTATALIRTLGTERHTHSQCTELSTDLRPWDSLWPHLSRAAYVTRGPSRASGAGGAVLARGALYIHTAARSE